MNFLGNGRQVFYYEPTSPPVTVKYHGLLNQGATCYLNSVLQVLFMTKDFREAVERHSCENHTKCIDGHLKTLFDDLKERTAYTYKITKKLGIDRVYEQRDAAEYFEKILRLTSPEAAQIFHGQLIHKTTCSACGTETETDGPFWHLPLALVDSVNNEDYSVVNSIEEYFRASYFSGENQMYCDQCDGKSDATTKCVMKRHPEVLMLLLKRFEFDYHYMTYVKINCTVDVPCTLQIPENQTYELYAVVEHFGDLRSGHYTAIIKSQDDERWWSFNDDRVTLLHYQPFQVDNFEKSSSAYLLFYRKKNRHAADTCTQDIKEVSPPGGFPPATSDIYDQCQDTGKMKEREEVEWAAEAGNDTAVAVSTYRYEETGIKDIVSVGSRGVGLSPNLCYKAEDQGNDVRAGQSIPYNHQECNEERNDLHPQDAQTKKQKDEGKIITDDEEDMGGNAEADDQAEKRETLSQLEESVMDQDSDSGRLHDVRQRRPDVNQDFKPEVSDRYAIHGHLNKQDEMNNAQRRVMDVKTDKDGKTGDDEESEKKGKSLTKYLDRDVEPDNEGLVDVRKNINEDLGGTREVGQDYDLKPVSVYKKADEERMKVDREGKTVTDERGVASGREKLYNEFQDNGGVGDSEQNKQKDEQGTEQGRSSRYKRSELQREEKRDVTEDKKQKRGDDKHAQMTAISERQQHFRQDVEDQNNGRLDDVRQNRSEQKISVTHTRHKDVSVVKQAKEQENKRDEPTQNRADSSLRRAGLAGNRSLTENQGVGSVEKTRQGDSQPKAGTEFNENTVEGRRGSEKSRTCYDGTQRSSETKYKRIQTVQGTSQDSIKSRVENNAGNVKRRADEKTDAEVSLSEGVCNLKLSEAPLQEPQKHTTKRVTDNIQEENDTNSTVHSNAKKKRKVSDTQEEVAEMDVMKKRGAHEKKRKWRRFSASRKQHRKEKSKKNKIPECFPFSCKSQKNAEQTSESD